MNLMNYTETTWETLPDYKASFVASSENFTKSQRGLPYFSTTFKFHARDLTITDEAIYEKHPVIESFKDARVLVVGGGPSTRDCEWNPAGYDLVCSCNHFYLNPRVRDIVNFATMCDEIHLFDRNLDDLNCVYCFENANRDVSYFYKKYFNKTMLAHTRYLSKIGSTSRLLCLVTLFGAAEIDIIGMDGYPPGTPHHGSCNHTFEVDKMMQGVYSYELYYQQYLELWKYLKLKIGASVKYTNLGYGHPYNITSLILDKSCCNWKI